MTTWYINADTGNDTTGDGSSGNPWSTLSKAYTSAVDGDTIYCQSATANYTFSNQTLAKTLVIRGVSPVQRAVFDGASTARVWTISKNLTIKNIEFQNITQLVFNSGIFLFAASSTVEFQNCIFRDLIIYGRASARGGMVALSTPCNANLTFDSCLLENITNTFVAGGSEYPTLFGNFQLGYNIYLDFSHCVIYTGSATNMNVILFGQHQNAITHVTLTNSIISNQSGATQYYKYVYGTSGNILTTCDFHNITDVPSGTGNITSDPLFYDAANGNFNLRPMSPCIGSGTLV